MSPPRITLHDLVVILIDGAALHANEVGQCDDPALRAQLERMCHAMASLAIDLKAEFENESVDGNVDGRWLPRFRASLPPSSLFEHRDPAVRLDALHRYGEQVVSAFLSAAHDSWDLKVRDIAASHLQEIRDMHPLTQSLRRDRPALAAGDPA